MSPMAEKRRKYTREFKEEAVRLLKGGDRSLAQIARDIGVSDTTLWGWANGRSKGPQKSTSTQSSLTEAEENRQLRRENALLREEREILKKAMAFFAKESK
jgi:transposase